mgnify:CR=1 FL=1
MISCLMGTAPITELNVEASLPSAVWGRFVAPFLAGDEPFVEQASFDEVALDDLLGTGPVLARVGSEGRTWVLAEVDACTVVLQGFNSGVSVSIRGANREAVAKAMVEVRSRAPQRAINESMVPFDFWQVDNGAYTSTRRISCPDWESVASNYPPEVRAELERLIAHRPQTDDGRIILWHGPPGTGKTTAIRALARAWGDQRRVQVILDPDLIFARASTLMEVLMRDNDESNQWRTLVVEDADELLREDAKDRVGQALSRLLNVGDGLLGQGLKVQVLITTNEPVKRLHPALVRAGRCLADIDFRRFTRAEAQAAFDGELPAGDELTLAQILNPGTEEEVIDLTGTGLCL